jgi:hypothetical protein
MNPGITETRMKKIGILWIGLMGLFLAGWLLTGCEQTDSVAGVAITPSDLTMTSSNSVQQFSATPSGPLGLPLEWSVQDPSLGAIVSSSGSNAVYASAGVIGNQVITCKDQYGAEGFATVHQF